MTPLFALRTLLFAGELLAGSMIIILLAWAFASRERASARHLAWASAFGALLLLPLMAAIIPSPLRILLPAPPEMIPVQSLSEAAAAATLPAPPDSGVTLDPATIASGLGALWLVGIIVLLLRFAASVFCLAALRRRSRPFALPPEELPRIAATRRECELRISDSETGPITWGIFRPVVLLPRTAIFWPRERLHAVLLHELAHIRRRDSLVQALSLFVCTLYWPNPLVWLGARALRRDAEMAADDAALLAGVKPSSYAGELLALAAEFRTRAPALSVFSLFMAAPSALEARVQSVLEPATQRMGVTMKDVIRITGLGLVAAGAIAFACPSLAQDTQSQSAAVETAPLPPVAPVAPPAPEAPAAPQAAVPAAPPAPDAPPAPEAPSTGHHIHIHLGKLSQADREELHREIARAKREAHEAIARARPEIERAIAQSRTAEEAARAAGEAQPEIDAAVAKATSEARKAVEEARPEIARAVADAKISEHAMNAVRAAEPAIDAAMDEAIAKYDSREVRDQVDRALAEAREEIAKAHIDARVEERVNRALDRAEQKLNSARMRAKTTEGSDVPTAHEDHDNDADSNGNDDSTPDDNN